MPVYLTLDISTFLPLHDLVARLFVVPMVVLALADPALAVSRSLQPEAKKRP